MPDYRETQSSADKRINCHPHITSAPHLLHTVGGVVEENSSNSDQTFERQCCDPANAEYGGWRWL